MLTLSKFKRPLDKLFQQLIFKSIVIQLNILQNTIEMSLPNQDTSFFQFTSILSNSYIASEAELLNELSIKFIKDEKLSIIVDHQQTPNSTVKRQLSEQLMILQLKRNTSFEEILVQNHKSIILISLRQYFKEIQFESGQETAELNQKTENGIQDLKLKQIQLLNTLKNRQFCEEKKTSMTERLKHNLDQTNIIHNIANQFSREIRFQLTYIMLSIFQECQKLIQNFNRKSIGRQLKAKGIQMSKSLRKEIVLAKIFEGKRLQVIGQSFEVLLQKLLISLFLMKVGIFDNELQTKSIEQCLKSQIFKQIRMNDLFNQHIMKPSKRRKV